VKTTRRRSYRVSSLGALRVDRCGVEGSEEGGAEDALEVEAALEVDIVALPEASAEGFGVEVGLADGDVLAGGALGVGVGAVWVGSAPGLLGAVPGSGWLGAGSAAGTGA
jgi:hypothetical protein